VSRIVCAEVEAVEQIHAVALGMADLRNHAARWVVVRVSGVGELQRTCGETLA
jgi:hypothetical protein